MSDIPTTAQVVEGPALTLDRLQKTIEYWRKHLDELEQKTNGLALKMGIDPRNDILFVPESWLKRYDWRREYLPDWIKVNPLIEQAYIGKGVKNDQLLKRSKGLR